MQYRVCVTRKNGEKATELEIHRGSLPVAGDEIDVELRGGSVRARVGASHAEAGKMSGNAVIEVHASEI
jgi:hypothetical protein